MAPVRTSRSPQLRHRPTTDVMDTTSRLMEPCATPHWRRWRLPVLPDLLSASSTYKFNLPEAYQDPGGPRRQEWTPISTLNSRRKKHESVEQGVFFAGTF